MPDVAPALTGPESAEGLALTTDALTPMFTELLPIDMANVAELVRTDNFDIAAAKQQVALRRGQYESTVGQAFPVLAPMGLFNRVDGTNPNSDGRIFNVGFYNLYAGVALQWVVNPGQVYYEILAARKQVQAAEYDVHAVQQQILQRAVVRFYELALQQARVAAARQGLSEAEELARIKSAEVRAGTGVRADLLRAEARLAEREQQLVQALFDFYQASILLGQTLQLDPTVTLVPRLDTLPPIRLVRDDIPIKQLLEFAFSFRPELQRVREVVEAAGLREKSTWWTSFGPGLAVEYRYGGFSGHANNVIPGEGIPGTLIVNPASPTGSFSPNPVANGLIREGIRQGSIQRDGRDDVSYGFRSQHLLTAGATWRLSLSAFGDLKSAEALNRQVVIEGDRLLLRIQGEVVMAMQASRAHEQMIRLGTEAVESAEEALRLAEAYLRAGTTTTVDVLQQQDAANQARVSYAESVVRFNQAQVNLLTALGLLNEEAVLKSATNTISDESAKEMTVTLR